MRMKMVSMSVIIAISLVCTVSALPIGTVADGTDDETYRDGQISMDEYNQMVTDAVAEVESKLGMSYEDYCSYADDLQGSVIYIHFVDGSVAVDIVKSIDAGRTGFEWSGNGFDIYLDSLVMAGGVAVITGAMTGSMNPLVGVIAGTAVAVAMQYCGENYCPNGIVLHYSCYWRVSTPFGSFNVYHYPNLERVGAQ